MRDRMEAVSPTALCFKVLPRDRENRGSLGARILHRVSLWLRTALKPSKSEGLD